MLKVSVIVPNYNHAPYLKQRIDSILNQSYQNFELILMDDCSVDNSKELLLSYKDHPKVSQIIINESNSGSPFAQWNKGIALAKGEYIWIAESDDWADEIFLEVLVAEADKRPNVGLIYSLAKYVSVDGVKLWETSDTGEKHEYKGSEFIQRKLLVSNSIYNVSMTIFKTKLFVEINHTLYEKMKLCGDWFFYVLMSEHTDVLEIEKAYTYYRIHNQSTSSQTEVTGKPFLEGVEILDYIIGTQPKLNRMDCAYRWAQQWIMYSKQYKFSTATNTQIMNKMLEHHRLIVVFYFLLKLKVSAKSLLKGLKVNK